MAKPWVSVAMGVTCSAFLQVACSGDSDNPSGQGGASGSGGATATGGASVTASSSGGSSANVSTTTAIVTGGTSSAGGASSTALVGGAGMSTAMPTGGTASGGSNPQFGGTTSSGGMPSTGGVLTGGAATSTTSSETGGSSTSGGAATGGASTGGLTAESGGATANSGGTSGTGGTAGCTLEADTCPKGQYCESAGNCIKGCKGNTDCVSNQCDASHSCTACVSDDECATGLYCSSGSCLGACEQADAGSTCGDAFTCCTDVCANTSMDIANCGGCGVQCTATQFCTANGCTQTIIGNLCQVSAAVGVLVETRDDDATKAALAALDYCSVNSRESLQSSGQVLNSTTGQPITRGELLVAFGGDAFQALVKFEETRNRFTPIYSTYADHNWQFLLSSNDQVIATLPNSDLSKTSHDIFVIEAVRDPATGTPMLLGYGMDIGGTTAAAWYFSNVMVPSIANFDKSWYVFEWTRLDDAGPIAEDQFVLKGSG